VVKTRRVLRWVLYFAEGRRHILILTKLLLPSLKRRPTGKFKVTKWQIFTRKPKLIRCNDVNWISVSYGQKVTFFEQDNKFQMSKSCLFLSHLEYSMFINKYSLVHELCASSAFVQGISGYVILPKARYVVMFQGNITM
jgi:hypothetical protein